MILYCLLMYAMICVQPAAADGAGAFLAPLTAEQRKAMSVARTLTDSFGGIIRTLAYNDPQQKLLNGRGMTLWTLIGMTYNVVSLSATSMMIVDPKNAGSIVPAGLALSFEVVTRCSKSDKAPKERGISLLSLLCLTLGTAATTALNTSNDAALVSLKGVDQSNVRDYSIAAWSYLALSFMPGTASLLLDDGSGDVSRLQMLLVCLAGIYAGQAVVDAAIIDKGPW